MRKVAEGKTDTKRAGKKLKTTEDDISYIYQENSIEKNWGDLITRIIFISILSSNMKISGTDENINLKPKFALDCLRICKGIRQAILGNQDLLGLRHIDEAREEFAELETKLGYKPIMPQRTFVAIKAIEADLLTQYTGENHYVGVGNSPTILLARLGQMHTTTNITNLPLGNIGLGTDTSKSIWLNLRNNIINHLDKFLNSPHDIESVLQSLKLGKNIIIIDYIASGVSLRLTRDLIIFYFLEKLMAKDPDSFNFITNEAISDEVAKFLNLSREEKLNSIRSCPTTLEQYCFLTIDRKNIDEQILELFYDSNGNFTQGDETKIATSVAREMLLLNSLLERVKIYGFLSPVRISTTFGEDLRFTDVGILGFNARKYLPLSPNTAKYVFLSGNGYPSDVGKALRHLHKMLNAKLLKGKYKFTLFESVDYTQIKNWQPTAKPTPSGFLRVCANLEVNQKHNP